MSQRMPDAEAAARKREQIGLSSRRVTAREVIIRPPEQSNALRLQHWLVVGLVAAMVVVTVALVAARIRGDATDARAVGGALSAIVEGASTLAPNARVTLGETFDQAEGPLVRDFQPDRWSMGAVPEAGVYRIRTWPGVIAWSTLGVRATDRFRLATSATINPATPWGYAGLMGRYTDNANLYLVQVDGGGRLRVLVQQEGVWTTLHDWTAYDILNAAGAANELIVEENDGVVTVYGNGQPLWHSQRITLRKGDSGVVAGSLQNDVAEANFDWVQFAELP